MMKKLILGAILAVISIPAQAGTFIRYEATGIGDSRTFDRNANLIALQPVTITAYIDVQIDPDFGCTSAYYICYTSSNHIIGGVIPTPANLHIVLDFDHPLSPWPITADGFTGGTFEDLWGDITTGGGTRILGTFDHLTVTIHEGENFSTTVGYTLAARAPEPASWALMIGGFALAGAAMRRRPRAQSTGLPFHSMAASRAS